MVEKEAIAAFGPHGEAEEQRGEGSDRHEGDPPRETRLSSPEAGKAARPRSGRNGRNFNRICSLWGPSARGATIARSHARHADHLFVAAHLARLLTEPVACQSRIIGATFDQRLRGKAMELAKAPRFVPKSEAGFQTSSHASSMNLCVAAFSNTLQACWGRVFGPPLRGSIGRQATARRLQPPSSQVGSPIRSAENGKFTCSECAPKAAVGAKLEVPGADYRIAAGDTLLLAGNEQAINRFVREG